MLTLTAESSEALSKLTVTPIGLRVIEYADEDGEKSVVSSCDLYEFENGLLVHIRSYAGVRAN